MNCTKYNFIKMNRFYFDQSGEKIANTEGKVILAFTSVSDFTPIIAEMLWRNITKKQWIASEGWIDSSVISAQDTINMFQGTIGFALSRRYIPGFHDYIIKQRPNHRNMNRVSSIQVKLDELSSRNYINSKNCFIHQDGKYPSTIYMKSTFVRRIKQFSLK